MVTHPDDVEVYGKMTECKCPKCCKIHLRKIRWIGRGTPRMFCDNCAGVISEYDNNEKAHLNAWAAVRNTVAIGVS